MRRRLRIKKEGLGKFGHIAGCSGCRAANRGTTAVGHTEECTKMVAEEQGKVGDVRLDRVQESLFEHPEELESENKRKMERVLEIVVGVRALPL